MATVSPRRTLLLEGGGLRGAFTAGVVAELAGAGAGRFADIIAVSSGAPTGAYLAMGQMPECLDVWTNYTHGAQLIALRNLARGRRLLDVQRLVGVFERQVPMNVAQLDASDARLFIAVTDCRDGSLALTRANARNVFPLLRATMALPIANGEVIDVEGVPCIDGGVVDPVPLERALGLGADETVVVLTQPRGYRRRPERALSLFAALTYPRFPSVRAAFRDRSVRANLLLARIDALEDAGRLTVIRPRAPLPASRLSRQQDDIVRTLEVGRAAAREYLWRKRNT